MNRDKVLEKYILKLAKEMIDTFKTENNELKKDNYEILKDFYISILQNEEIYKKILLTYPKDMKVIDYYFENSQYLYEILISKKMKYLEAAEGKICGYYLINNQLDIDGLKLLKRIFNKTVDFKTHSLEYEIEITKCPGMEKEAIISLNEKNRTLVKS